MHISEVHADCTSMQKPESHGNKVRLGPCASGYLRLIVVSVRQGFRGDGHSPRNRQPPPLLAQRRGVESQRRSSTTPEPVFTQTLVIRKGFSSCSTWVKGHQEHPSIHYGQYN